MGLLGDIVSTALGFVPVAGPVLSKGYDAIRGSNSAKTFSENIKSGIGGAVGALPSTLIQNRLNQANSARAFSSSMGAYKTRYQNTTADMRAAGLNPVLAASGGFNVGNAPTRPMIPGVDMSSGASSAKNFRETEQMDTIRTKIIADTFETMERTETQKRMQNKISEETLILRKELRKRILEITKVATETEKIVHDIALQKRQWVKVNAQIRIIESQINKYENLGFIYGTEPGLLLNIMQELRRVISLGAINK